MKSGIGISLGVITLMGSIAVSGSVFATGTGSANVRSHSLKSVTVLSEGNNYTKLSQLKNMTAQLDVSLRAPTVGRVKNWEAWLSMRLAGGTKIQFNQYSDGASYSRPRPKEVNTVASLFIPASKIQSFAVASCQKHANKLRIQGLSKDMIFSKDWTLIYGLEGSFSYQMTGVDWGNELPDEVGDFNARRKFKVICKASPGPTRNPADNNPSRTKPKVKSASLSVQGVSTLNGACMLKLKGKIKGEKTGQKIRFRYKDGQGHQSEIKTVKTKTLKTARFTHQYALSGSGLKTGKIRIDVEGSTVNSPWINYSVNCRGGSAPDGFSSSGTGRPGGPSTEKSQ